MSKKLLVNYSGNQKTLVYEDDLHKVQGALDIAIVQCKQTRFT